MSRNRWATTARYALTASAVLLFLSVPATAFARRRRALIDAAPRTCRRS